MSDERTTERIRQLKKDATEEDIAPSESSEQDLMRYLSENEVSDVPYIFLLENGNFRALWRKPEGQHAGFQFLGGGLVQYVIFSRGENQKTRLVSGQAPIDEMPALIESHGFDRA